MPHTQSAAKRLRQNEKRRLFNKGRLTELKSLVKGIDRALHDGEKPKAEELYRAYSQKVDQAAAKGVVHGNYAARHKSRLALRIAKGAAAATPTGAPKKAPRAKAAPKAPAPAAAKK